MMLHLCFGTLSAEITRTPKHALHASRMNEYDQAAQRCRASAVLSEMAEAMIAKPGFARRCCTCVLVHFLLNSCQIAKYALHASRMNQNDHAAQRYKACAMLSEMAEAFTAKPGSEIRYCCFELLVLCSLKLCQITKHALHAGKMNQHNHAAHLCRACALLIEMAEVMIGTYGPKIRYCCFLLLALCLLNPCQITKYALSASRMNQYDQAAQCCRACAMLLEMAQRMIAFLALREGTAALNFCHWNFLLIPCLLDSRLTVCQALLVSRLEQYFHKHAA